MKKILNILITFLSMLTLTACNGNKSAIVKDYSKQGEHTVMRYPEKGLIDNYVVYYPKDAITKDMPVVLFLEGGGNGTHIDNYRGIMEFMATHGYFVIGAESAESYDSKYAKNIFEKAIKKAKQTHGLTVSKLAIMGHSQGGGQAFYVMQKLQEEGYGKEGSLVLSIDGWFAFSMNKNDLKKIEGNVSFLQMNNLMGTGTDPRIHLTIWELLDKSNKSFYILPENNHGYVGGDLATLSRSKRDLLFIVHALCDDVFNNRSAGKNAIPSDNKTTYSIVKNALKDKRDYSDDCEGIKYNARASMLNLNDIDYCME